jgi:hypothetical protein
MIYLSNILIGLNLESIPKLWGLIHHVVVESLKFSRAEHWSCLWERTWPGKQLSRYSM